MRIGSTKLRNLVRMPGSGSGISRDPDPDVASGITDRKGPARAATTEDKLAGRARAGLEVPDGLADDGLSAAAADAKRDRLSARVADAQAAVTAAEGEIATLRAERVRAELAEQPGPDPADLKAAETRLAAARALLEDRQDAATAFRPAHLAAKRRSLSEREVELSTIIASQQTAIHGLEAEFKAKEREIGQAYHAMQGNLTARAQIQRQRDDLAREIGALRQRRP